MILPTGKRKKNKSKPPHLYRCGFVCFWLRQKNTRIHPHTKIFGVGIHPRLYPHTNTLVLGVYNRGFLQRCGGKFYTVDNPSSIFSLHLLGNRKGYTLIELLFVAAIILVITSLSTPLFKRTYADLKLSCLTKEMASIISFLHERAVFERMSFRFCIDMDKRSYRLLVEGEKIGEFKPLESKWGRHYHIPNDIEIETQMYDIDLLPDGSASSAAIYLKNQQGTTYTIIVEQDTGRVNVYDYRKE